MMHFEGYGYRASTFEQTYHCYPASFIDKPQLEAGDKIIMPQSALDRLVSLHIEYPMLFEVHNAAAERTSHCGVLEFVAEEGMIYMPHWMMQKLLLQEGDLVSIKNANLPKGKYVKLQPHTTDYLDISNHKAILEKTLRNFSCLSTGDSIMVAYNSKKYYIDIVETKPSNAICIIKADCMVELVPPFDYKEPVPVKPAVPANTEAATGRTLDGKLSKDKDVVGGVIPLCLAKVKTPALMKLKMLVDNHNEVHQYWELEVDEQVKGEMRRSVFQGPAVSTGGADPVGEIETPEPDATSCPSSIRGGGIGGIEAFGSGPRIPYTPEIKGYNPEYTRPVFHNAFHNDLWAFSIDEESTIQPLRHTAAQAGCLVWSANILSIKLLRSIVGYPVNLYGSVYVRDDLDRKRVYLFRRDQHNTQLVKSPEESLVFTGPSRGLVISDNLFFEIDLKMRCDREVDGMNFSQGSMQYSHAANGSWIVDHRSCLLVDELATEMSTVELMYAPVQRAVEASIRINALGSHRNGVLPLYGKVTAFITETPEEIVLFDSEASGAAMNIRDDGSFELWRSVISVPIDGSLTLS
ncbi:unnamed protein product [Urochloa humidicola]